MARSAHREAVGYFEQALSALAHLPEPRDTLEQAIDLRLALRSALSARSATLGVSWRSARGRDPRCSPRRPASAGTGLGFLSLHFYFRGAYDQAIAAAQRALALATASGEVVLQALANHYLGLAYQAQGDYRRAIDCLGQTVAALDGARRCERFGPVVLPAVLSRAYLAWCHAELGLFAEGRASGKKGSGLPRAVAHPGASCMPIGGLVCWPSAKATCPGRSPCSNGPWASVRRRTSRSFPWMAAALGAAYTLDGRVADAVPLLTQALEQAMATGTWSAIRRSVVSPWGGRSCWLAAWRRRTPLPSGAALTREHQERGNQAYALRLLGDIAARREPPEIEQAEPTTARPSPWPRSWVCARSRPTATSALALLWPHGPGRASPCRSHHRHRVVPRHGHDLLAAAGGSRLGTSINS